MEVPLTAGALRNRYLRLPRVSQKLCEGAVTLNLPDEERVTTRLTQGRMIQWRGWGRYYRAHAMQPGARVRLIALGQHHYRVTFHPRFAEAGP
jgi:hypothetical protein